MWASLLKGEDEKWKVRKECHSGYGRFYLMETRRRRKRATGRRYDDSRGRMWNVEGREVMIVRERICRRKTVECGRKRKGEGMIIGGGSVGGMGGSEYE